MVSVIIPIYNKEQYLNKCIESVINQTYDNLEIILINDGSSDNSLKICEEYKLKDNRIKIIDQVNSGVSVARNNGIDACTGEKLVFVDADDYVDKNYIKNLISCNEDLVICSYYSVFNNKIVNENSYSITFNSSKLINENILKKKYAKLICTPYLKLFNAKIIKDNKLYFNSKLSYGEDSCFVMNYLLLCKSVSFIDYRGYFNVVSIGTLSRKYVKDMADQLENLKLIIDKFDTPISDNNYWKFRIFKLILSNEKKSFSNFKKILMQNKDKFILKNDNFNFVDKTIIVLYNLKLYWIIYLIFIVK